MQRRELLILGTCLSSLGLRSARASQAPAVLEAELNGRALATSVQQSYGRLPGFRLHILHRSFDWRGRGHIDLARGSLSVTWNGNGATLLDSKTARSFDSRGALLHESALSESLLFLLAACLAKVADFQSEFALERDDEFPLRSHQPELLILRAKPRAAPLDRLMMLFVESRTFRLRRAQFVESGGARHRLDFTRLEHR